MIWHPRGKDSSGSDTWVGTTIGITYLITKHPVQGVCLWRIPGKELVSVGFTSVEGAKRYVDRNFHAVAD